MHLTAKPFVLALCLLVTASGALAQYGGGMGGRRGANAMGLPSSRPLPSESSSTGSVTNQVADRLYDLRMRLLITTEQTGPWDLFYNRAMALTGDSMRSSNAFAEQTAVQAIQQRAVVWQNRYTLMEQLSEAVKTLYTSLTPEQQRTADQYLPPVILGLDLDAGLRGSQRRGPG